MLGIYPVGNLVKLNTGEVAIVLQVHAPDRIGESARVFAADGGVWSCRGDINLWDTEQDTRDDRGLRSWRRVNPAITGSTHCVHLIVSIPPCAPEVASYQCCSVAFRSQFDSRCLERVFMPGFDKVVPGTAMPLRCLPWFAINGSGSCRQRSLCCDRRLRRTLRSAQSCRRHVAGGELKSRDFRTTR